MPGTIYQGYLVHETCSTRVMAQASCVSKPVRCIASPLDANMQPVIHESVEDLAEEAS